MLPLNWVIYIEDSFRISRLAYLPGVTGLSAANPRLIINESYGFVGWIRGWISGIFFGRRGAAWGGFRGCFFGRRGRFPGYQGADSRDGFENGFGRQGRFRRCFWGDVGGFGDGIRGVRGHRGGADGVGGKGTAPPAGGGLSAGLYQWGCSPRCHRRWPEGNQRR